MKEKKKSNWMKGFVITPPKTDIELADIRNEKKPVALKNVDKKTLTRI